MVIQCYTFSHSNTKFQLIFLTRNTTLLLQDWKVATQKLSSDSRKHTTKKIPSCGVKTSQKDIVQLFVSHSQLLPFSLSLSVRPSIHPSFRTYVHLSVCLSSVSVYVCVCMCLVHNLCRSARAEKVKNQQRLNRLT